ncbi:baculovirus repeated ORF d [Orgyia leucostigma nucleopolyhedrovirus]|uniref:Baculovirus repeated ORF d n=1 Tax=Orgyia leucostigma nucleopolyhedrovirus TaxID=490711 RepID=B0FDS9_9ABAC|nr:baculovirus repeated ORF d [Orgyia leucostigma nucleopolyhedrovirus]ABY65787.1 baculovirus repeated ORF d [Orgyia leucostigma nucleopolyhedrovirus]
METSLQIQSSAFTFNDKTLHFKYLIRNGEVLFVAKTIAKNLMFTDCDRAVSNVVDKKYKFVYGQLITSASVGVNKKKSIDESDPLYLHPNAVLIDKKGAVQLISKCKFADVVELQVWLLETVIPSILCTNVDSCVSSLPPPPLPNKNVKIDNSGNNNNLNLKNIEEKINLLESALVQKDELINQIIESKDRQRDEIINVIVDKNNCRIDAVVASKDKQINRVMNDLNRMYNGFQDTLCQKNDLLKHTIEMLDVKEQMMERAMDMVKNKDLMLQQALDLIKSKDDLLEKNLHEAKIKDELLSKIVDANGSLIKRVSELAEQRNIINDRRCYDNNDVDDTRFYVTRRGKTFMVATGQRSYIDSRKKQMCGRVVVNAKRLNSQFDWNHVVALVNDDNDGSVAIKSKHKRLIFKSDEAATNFEIKLKSHFY